MTRGTDRGNFLTVEASAVASVTAALAGTMHALYKPVVSPEIATMGHTVDALLITSSAA